MCALQGVTTEEIGTGILFPLKIMREISNRVKGSSERKEILDNLRVTDANSCVFHIRCMINISALLANREILGFLPLYSI